MLVWLGKNRLGQRETEEKPLMPNDAQLTTLIDEIKAFKGDMFDSESGKIKDQA